MNKPMQHLVSNEPDFMRILNSFRAENARGTEIMLSIYTMAKSLKPLTDRPQQTIMPDLQKNDPCVTGQLWAEIEEFKRCNDKYSEIYDHLRDLIGTQ